MKTLSIKDYFIKCISLTSSVMPEDMRLTWKEIQFLGECCDYNYHGGNLNDFKTLSEHFLDIRFFKKTSDCSVYKTKVANKRWITSGRDLFELIPQLNTRDFKDLKFKIELEYEHRTEGSPKSV